MEDRFVTSEEKLLKVIRQQDKLRSATKATKRMQSASGDIRKDSTIGLLKFFNRVFVLVSICSLAFLIYKYFELEKVQSQKVRVEPATDGAVSNDVASNLIVNPEEFFTAVPEVAVTRDIFEAPWEKPQEAVVPGQEAVVGPDLKTVVRVAGIVLDQSNSQVIVEDLVSGETVFLSKGQEIKGAQLTEIFENKAVFLYQNQNVELTP